MYRVYNLRPQPAPANWARDNRHLIVGLVFWSLFLPGIAGSQRVSSDGWYVVTQLEGALVTMRMPVRNPARPMWPRPVYLARS